MRNFLANILNAWVRGTLHALNGVLFAKYLSMAWGMGSTMAATVSGATAGLWLMRGHILSAGFAAVRLFRAAPDVSHDSEKSERN